MSPLPTISPGDRHPQLGHCAAGNATHGSASTPNLNPENLMATQFHPAANLIALTPATRAVINAIVDAGGRPYLVGGSVRDAIRHPGTAPKDIDIEVFDIGIDKIAPALRGLGRVDDNVGESFSVLKLTIGTEDFDVSVPRREVKTGPGYNGFTAVPDPDATFEQASARRDYTLNALMFDPIAEVVIDCWGGLDDLSAGILRHTSDTFGQDPLRVLRAVGFAGRFGFTLAPQTVTVCRQISGTFDELFIERIWTEWSKIARQGRYISNALNVLDATAWIEHFPQLAALRGVPQDPTWHPEGDVFTHSGLAADKAAELADAAGLSKEDREVIVLAALMHDFGKVTHTRHVPTGDGPDRITSAGHAAAGVTPVRAFLESIGAPQHLAGRIAPLVREHMAATGAAPTKPAVRRLARRLAPATIAEWAMIVEADKGGRGAGSRDGGTAAWVAVAENLGAVSSPVPSLLNGRHLIAAGLRPGPHFGPILAAALEAQDDGVFTDEAGAITWFHQYQVSTASQ